MVTVREATIDDCQSIYEVHVASIRGVDTAEYSDEEMAVWESGPSPKAYSVSEPETAFLVAEVESEIAGFAEASLDTPELAKLYVHPTFQRRGIAAALVDAIERRVRDHAEDSLYVEASVNAVPFYERVGFRRTGSHEKTVSADTKSVDMTMVDMKKDLR